MAEAGAAGWIPDPLTTKGDEERRAFIPPGDLLGQREIDVSEGFETDPLRQAVEETISAHPDAVQRWIQNQPGAWGFLAGQGILAYRRRLGRRLTDGERRALWQALWTALETLRGG